MSSSFQLGSSGTGFFGCSCLPKAVTGVSQPGVGLESAYSGPRVELRPPVYPSPVLFAPTWFSSALCTLAVAVVIRGGMAIGQV